MGSSEVDAIVRGRDRPSPRFAHVRALDGFRGLAVTLVVIYHFAPNVLPAGFLGVDVFFVLSGFLITSLALGEHHGSGRVAVGAFFARRSRRLLPAAITTIVVSVAIAIAVDPDSYRASLRGQAVTSLLYVNNWWAIAQNDTYQAVFGAESPLTHFWSLSIEEQFYLLFPFVLLGLIAIVRRRNDASTSLAKWLIVIAGVGSLASAARMAILYDPLVEPSRLYYGTDTRLQAVLLGVAGACAVWLWRDRVLARVPGRICTASVAITTVILLVAAVRGGFLQGWLYRGGFFALSLAALISVVAVVVHRGIGAKVFELGPLVVLGLYSYGIYLWHWPVKVFLDPDRTGLDGVALFVVRVAVTAVATIVSARLIERPFRAVRSGAESPRMVRMLRSPRGAVAALGAMALALATVWIIARPVSTDYANSVADAPTIVDVPTGPLRVMWTGDSVAWTMAGGDLKFPQPPGYESVFDPTRIVLWNLGTYPCPMIEAPSRSLGAVRSDRARCWDRETGWPEWIALFHPDALVWNGALFDLVDVNVDGRWLEFGSPEWDDAYLAAIDQARAAATVEGTTFVLVGQPDPVVDPSEEFHEALLPQNVWRYSHLRDLQRTFAEEHRDDTRFVDLAAILCPKGVCPDVSSSGVVLRPDGVHWSVEGARVIAPIITDALLGVLGRPVSN